VMWIPALAMWLFRRGVKIWENPVIHWVGDFYERLLIHGMRRAKLVVLVSVGLVAGSLLLASRLGTEFLPQLDEGVIWIRANLPPGVSLSNTPEIPNPMPAPITQSPELHILI